MRGYTPTDEPLYLLGRVYEPPPSASRAPPQASPGGKLRGFLARRARGGGGAAAAGTAPAAAAAAPADCDDERRRRRAAFETDWASLVWLTYRRDFASLPASSLRSDAGWGCMVRSGQMLLAQALRIHFLTREWRGPDADIAAAAASAASSSGAAANSGGGGGAYARLLRWFGDDPSPHAPYSIHNLLRAGASFGKPAGQWFGPSEVCAMLRRCHIAHGIAEPRVVVADQGMLYRDALAAELAVSPQQPPAAAAAAASSSSPPAMRACVLLLPLRLGAERIAPEYADALLACFRMPQSLGCAGGRVSASLYFAGAQGRHLLYLDPHTVQRAAPLAAPLTRELLATYHCRAVRAARVDDVDPSLALGFYCRDGADLADLLARLAALPAPLIFVRDSAPRVDLAALDALAEADMPAAAAAAAPSPPRRRRSQPPANWAEMAALRHAAATSSAAREEKEEAEESEEAEAAEAAEAAAEEVEEEEEEEFVML
jgi:cysteine protease ATG4